jgi:hypothetical protein
VLIPKWVIGVAVGAGLALLGIGYLLGERSYRGARDTSPASPASWGDRDLGLAPRPGNAPDSSAEADTSRPARPEEVLSEPPPRGGEPNLERRDPAPDAGAAFGASPANAFAADVRRYLDEFERIQEAGAAVSDPREYATALLNQAQSGDMRGIDDLVLKSERMNRELAGLRPPAPCALHHRSASDLAASGISLLRKLRGAIEEQDLRALTSIASEGSAMESKAKSLAAETERLRREYR